LDKGLGDTVFKVKDEVVYPGHGVAIIEEAITKHVGESTTIFFKLLFKYKDMCVLVPREKLEECGVRFVSKKEVVNEALQELALNLDIKKIFKEHMTLGWNRRQKEYLNKLETGVLLEVARTYRDLKRFSQKKTLSFGEKGIMLTAEDLLYQEVLEATKMGREEVLREIRRPFEEIVEVGRPGT
jgi:CarD family transcriptional regulator